MQMSHSYYLEVEKRSYILEKLKAIYLNTGYAFYSWQGNGYLNFWGPMREY